MALKNADDERRNAERFALPKAAHATFGGFDAEIIEVSLIGCQILHVDRITPRSRLPLRFKWRGGAVRIEATVIRSEMRSVGGKPAYMSGLSFCESAQESPAVIREMVGWLADAAKKAAPPPTAPPVEPSPEPLPDPPVAADEDADVLSAVYLQCRLSGGTWDKIYVEKPEQPPEGFTIIAPSSDAEVDVLCRTYQTASVVKRREMRAVFARAIKQGGSGG